MTAAQPGYPFQPIPPHAHKAGSADKISAMLPIMQHHIIDPHDLPGESDHLLHPPIMHEDMGGGRQAAQYEIMPGPIEQQGAAGNLIFAQQCALVWQGRTHRWSQRNARSIDGQKCAETQARHADRQSIERGALPGEPFIGPDIVLIGEGDETGIQSFPHRQQREEARDHADMIAAYKPYPCIAFGKGMKDLFAAVARSVITDDQANIDITLRQDGSDLLNDEVSAPEGG